MFEIMPFDRRTYRMSCYNPLRELEQMEKSFWGEQQVNPFRTERLPTATSSRPICRASARRTSTSTLMTTF